MKRFLLIVCVLSCLMLSGCTQNQMEVNLSGSWKISDSDTIDASSPSFDDSEWQEVTLPGPLSSERGKQVHWLRIHFFLPERLAENDLSLFMGKLWDVDESYLNGVKIGQTGSLAPDFFSSWNVDRWYRLPQNILHSGDNVISVRIFSNQKALFPGKPFIGKTHMVEKNAFRMRSLAQYIPLAGGAVTLIFGIVSLFSFLYNRKDRVSLLYAIISFLYTIQTTHFYLPSFGVSYELHDQLYYIILMVIGFLIYIFLNMLLECKNKYLTFVTTGLFIAAQLICLTATSASPMAGWRSDVIGIIGLIFQITWIVAVVPKIKQRRARIILVGCVILGLSVIHDGLSIANIISTDFYWFNLGYPFLILSFGSIIALSSAINVKQLALARDALQDYATHLAEKVEERTAQLSEAKNEIEIAMHKTEELNKSLVSSNFELENAQKIAMLDTNMAFNVQKGFFPKQAPENEEWEVAFMFRPMSGVSGDFYDFYVRDGKLEGLSLFDVSGHGIASGLITLLARSIVAHEFFQRKNQKLSVIIDAVNNSITDEIQNIDNYITGIVLRFKGDLVEYVNAGHTDLLVKRGKSVRVVKPKDRPLKGHFLGIQDMQETFDMISFHTIKNDVLFLFSDCLSEGRNNEGEEFGIERLIKSIESTSGQVLAKDCIEAVARDFYAFQGSDHLSDDLTIIAARRLL